MGDRAGAIHPATARNGLTAGQPFGKSPGNLDSYRITDDDRLGAGGPKQKFQQNLKAVQIIRTLIHDNRHALADEKTMLVKYVGWGAMP